MKPFAPEPTVETPQPPVTQAPAPVSAPTPPLPAPTIVLSEADSYIAQRMQEQAQSLEEVKASDIEFPEDTGHRLQLPEFFEQLSYDCTRGNTCAIHKWSQSEETLRWHHSYHGEWIFRWVWKTKRSVDEHLNVRGWLFVNRTYFPEAPTHLFSANGSLEEGANLLMFMPAKKALALRSAPSRKSLDRIRSRVMLPDRRDPKRVLMTSDQSDPRHYQPSLTSDEPDGVSGVEAAPPAPEAFVEGRDF